MPEGWGKVNFHGWVSGRCHGRNMFLLDCEVLGALGMCGKDRRGRGREPHQDKVAG